MTVVPALLVTATLPTTGGDPLDATSNSFAFTCDAVDGTSVVDAANTVQDFYKHAISANSLDTLLGSQLSRAANAAVLRVYDISNHLDGTPHGSPVYIQTFTLDAAAVDTDLPEGVGVAVSFHAAYGTDVEFGVGTRPRARDRGRVYLGPLTTLMSDQDGTTKRIFVTASRRVQLASHADYMRTNPHGTCIWGVWSRKNATIKNVVGGWVDDRFDYQRRREDQGVVRSVFP